MDRLLTERNRHILQGAIGLLLLVAAVTAGIKISFGALDSGYELHGTFASAGQGLIEGSDIKIRGVNVGEVTGIELVQNRALITMRVDPGVKVPADAQAVIRPKTLFGEKFVDIDRGKAELTGPYLDDGDEITNTLGGFELEQVLSDAYPVLRAIEPTELYTVVHELALAADGVGENINRSLVNGAVLSQLAVSNDAEFRQFTDDLALLVEELDRVAPAVVAGARDLNVALPTLTANADTLTDVLADLSRLAGDVADVVENNRAFTDSALTEGSKTLAFLYERRSQLRPLLRALQEYTQSLSEVLRIELSDGSLMGAVKQLSGAPIGTPAAAGTGTGEGARPQPATAAGGASDPEGGRTPIDQLLDLLVGGGG